MSTVNPPQITPEALEAQRLEEARTSNPVDAALVAELKRLSKHYGGYLGDQLHTAALRLDELTRVAHETESNEADSLDAARWRHAQSVMCHSFDGQNRTYYLRAKGRESFQETIDKSRAQKAIGCTECGCNVQIAGEQGHYEECSRYNK